MAPRTTSDGRAVPRLLGARQRTMSLIAAVLEDEARRDAPARRRRRSKARGRAGFVVAAGLGCVLSALAGGVAAWWLHTPELDRLDEALVTGGVETLAEAVEGSTQGPRHDSPRARASRAHALAQRAVWGEATLSQVELAMPEGADEPHARDARRLLQALRGVGEQGDAWSQGLVAGRTLDLARIDGSIEGLQRSRTRTVGASRTLAALQFTRGDVSASLATLSALNTRGARADAAFYAALAGAERTVTSGAPGRTAILQAELAWRGGDETGARALLHVAREDLLRWDSVGIVATLRMSLLAGDVEGLVAWAADATWSDAVRGIARAYAAAAGGRWADAERLLEGHDVSAPWVAYVRARAAAERGRWPDAVRLAAKARRGLPGRPELEVLAAWAGTHALDSSGAHDRLVALSARAPWSPRVWTARARAAQAVGRPRAEVHALYERALQREQRPADAAAALAAAAEGEEALHLWTMATEFAPDQHGYRIALGHAQLERGRLAEAWENLQSMRPAEAEADGDAWLTVAALAVSRRELASVAALLTQAERAGAPAQEVTRARLELRALMGEDVSAEAHALSRRHPQDMRTAALAVRTLGHADRLPAARRWATVAMRGQGRSEAAPVVMALAAALRHQGELREAAQSAFKSWSALSSDAGALETLRLGQEAIDIWLELGNTSGARAIARELTLRLPQSPDAWLVRARVQHAANAPEQSCRSLARARMLDPNAAVPERRCQSA